MPEYELQIEGFQGPLHKLLELIEERKMEISRVSLASVTGDFMKYIEQLGGENAGSIPEVIASFITVATKLILLKSLLLLPPSAFTEDDEKEAVDLEERIRLYKRIKEAGKNIEKAWMKNEMFSRPFLRNIEPGFYFSGEISLPILLAAVKKVYSEAAVFSPAMEKREIAVTSLDEKIRKLIERINTVVTSSFSQLVEKADKAELVVVFLALLHLLKDNAIKVKQNEAFAEIIVEKV